MNLRLVHAVLILLSAALAVLFGFWCLGVYGRESGTASLFGAIAAFAAAWQRPDGFRRVFSAIGTYVGLRGGNEFPVLIRKTEPKPIRVFLQDGRNDLNNYAGSWFVANQDMLAALQFAGYDVTFEWGDGEHNSRHATALFPEALRWLWRDYPAPIKANAQGASKQDVYQTLVAGEDWQIVGEGYRATDGPAVNAAGEMFFTDTPNNRIYKAGADGQDPPPHLVPIDAAGRGDEKAGKPISFWQFTRYGLVVTAVTVGLTAPYLLLRY